MNKFVSFAIASCICLCACSPPDDNQSVEDASMVDTDDGIDAGRDAESPDVGDLGIDTAPTTCELPADCEPGGVCVEGICERAEQCGDVNDWKKCVTAFTEFGPEFALRAMCGSEGFCRAACLDDGECANGETCTDYGYCRPFTGNLDAPRPGGGARASLRAGVAEDLLYFPIGISMAGFGSRGERNAGRYSGLLSDSVGQFHGMYSRAFALDNGERQLIVVRLPIIFASAWLHEAVARRLQEETGEDWRDSLVISTTHSHSGPARFWPLPDDAALDAGRLGSDAYSHAAFEWIANSAYEVASAALADLQPAQFGWTIVESFDTDDALASDRWGETPPFDDNRLLMLRIDDEAGEPLVAVISMGMHSTFNTSDYLTGDAAGMLERQFELELGRRHNRTVPVMFLSENSGTMSPRGDRRGHRSLHQHEYLGVEFASRVVDDFASIETSDDISMEAETHMFPISYRRVGYEIGEWARGNAGTYESTFFHGGIQCAPPADEDYADHAEPFSYICLPTHFMSQNRPVSIFRRSMITALRIDGLNIVTLPGESSMEVGWQVLREARDRLGIDPLASFVWGYAQDHQLYISPTNLRGELPVFPGISTPMAPDEYPDFAFSWLQGGYEAGLSAWGHLFGDFMVERAVEAFTLLDDPDADVETALPAEFTPFATDIFPVEPTPTADVGTIVEDVPARVERLEPIEFGWVGGDPGIEAPQAPLVVLTREQPDGTFAPFQRENFRQYDNREPVLITRVRRNADRWEWIVYWEETRDFPAGKYRFEVAGTHGQPAGPYTLTSAAFVLAPTDDIVVTHDVAGDQLSGIVAYPAAPEFRVIATEADPGRVTGSYRLRNPRVPTASRDPVIVGEHLDPSAVEVRVYDESGSLWQAFSGAALNLETSTSGVPETTYAVDLTGAPANFSYEIDVTDAFGNRGEVR